MKRKSYARTHHNIAGYAFMLPWIFGFLAFTLFPLIYVGYLSFFTVHWTVEGLEITYVGIENYASALLRNPLFTPALTQFVTRVATFTPVITVVSFILALLLNRNIKFRAAFRALFFMPVIVISGPVVSHLMDVGGMSVDIRVFDMPLLLMVAQFSWRAADILILLLENYAMVLWFTGIPIVLILSGLQKIDSGILEAARIDSATSWQILWKITIPIIRPIVLVSMILTIVQLANFQNPVLPMIQNPVFTGAGLGMASAFSWIYTIVVLLLIGIAFLIMKNPREKEPELVKTRTRRWNEG